MSEHGMIHFYAAVASTTAPQPGGTGPLDHLPVIPAHRSRGGGRCRRGGKMGTTHPEGLSPTSMSPSPSASRRARRRRAQAAMRDGAGSACQHHAGRRPGLALRGEGRYGGRARKRRPYDEGPPPAIAIASGSPLHPFGSAGPALPDQPTGRDGEGLGEGFVRDRPVSVPNQVDPQYGYRLARRRPFVPGDHKGSPLRCRPLPWHDDEAEDERPGRRHRQPGRSVRQDTGADQPSRSRFSGSSSSSLILTRNWTASRPSTTRWS